MGTVLMCFIQTGSFPFIHLPFKLPSFSLRSVFSFIFHSQSKICLIGYELKLGLLQRKRKLFGFIVQYRLFFKKQTLPMRIYIAHAYKHWSNIQTQTSQQQADLLNQFKKTDCFYCEPLLCFYQPFKLPNSPIVVLWLLSTLEPYQRILS